MLIKAIKLILLIKKLHSKGLEHSYDILGARMLWKPKKSIKFVKIRAKECFDKVLNEEFKKNLM